MAVKSQQFPTSIGAQTANIRQLALHHVVVPAVPDFDRCSDALRLAPLALRSARVPAVPDFDRCSDRPDSVNTGSSSSPSSSRLRSVLRPDEMRVRPEPYQSQQFPTSIGAQT